ncbi:hypothetical protein T440DRAFT_24353 [Plenodomus tracheiphilus IPT5]|uniref:HRQ family protein 2 n=1 Tax=Plenodomus tracheiphilus IPT5 TaxID=1408161 RepID=A0A6A7BFK0_9PLEO|nr:hypothetical protein T440DRAFT_24353 [Plenodomus tracheiphilus IPT5]
MNKLGSFGSAPIWAGSLVLVVVFLLYRLEWIQKMFKTKSVAPASAQGPSEKSESQFSIESYYAITPLPNFDITTEEPLKLRPFKPKYHMTMAIENLPFSHLLPFDNTYLPRLTLRSHLLRTHPHETHACNPRAIPSVLELYTYLTHTYLPTRYPTLFTLHAPTHLQNTLTNQSLPLTLPPTHANAILALKTLCTNIDSEFLMLLPSPHPPDNGNYKLDAYINTFPSGFSTRAKLNMLLSDIHGPVPHYREKLERSMDRFFKGLGVGRCVRRANWSVSVGGELFCLEGNHLSVEEEERRKNGHVWVVEEEEEDVDLGKTVLRCERQTLHRLPGSGALVFAFKTYIYPIKELRDEGSGEILAEAIDGLAQGSVPGIAVYKKQVVWGEKVKAFLRGEIDA